MDHDLAQKLRRLMIPLAGCLIGFSAAVLVLSMLKLPYVPFDGTVGPPAFYDFSIRRKTWGYLLFTILPVVFGWLASVINRSLNREDPDSPESAGGWFTPVITVAAAFVMLFLSLHLLPQDVRRTYSPYILDASFLIQLALIAAAALFLSMPATNEKIASDAAQPQPVRRDALTLFAWTAVLFFHFWLILEPQFSSLALALAGAFLLAGVFVFALATGDSNAPLSRASRLESAAWWLLGLFPLQLLWVRFEKSFNPDHPLIGVLPYVGWAIIAAALASSGLRHALKQKRSISPMIFIPFAAAVIYRGCGLAVTEYDPYHQGEYIYPYHALTEGLVPFRDIFFVHGFGFNLIAGWALGDLIRKAPCLDIYFLDCLTTVGVFVMAWFYLKLWGPKWWLMTLVLAAVTAGAVPTKGCRYLAIYLLMIAIALYVRNSEKRSSWLWLWLAGWIAWAGTVFSFDTGAIAVVGGSAWCLIWGIWQPRQPTLRSRLAPPCIFMLGLAPGGILSLAYLIKLGVLSEFIHLYGTYAAIKYHYDNLPVAMPGLSYILSPLLTVIGTGALIQNYRANRDDRKAAESSDASSLFPAVILLLVIVNFLSFFRALDRSDEGHLIYGSVMAWPLLGTLVVWNSRHVSVWGAFARSAAVVGLLVGLPFSSPAIRGATAMIIPPHRMPGWYRQACNEPAAWPMETMKTHTAFFDFCEELDRSIESEAGPRYLFDMSNQPALYYWTSLRCPTRFYALYYTSNSEWQHEVSENIKDKAGVSVLWPGPNQPRRKTDGIDLQLRNYAISACVLQRFHPEIFLQDGSFVMKPGAPEAQLDSKFIHSAGDRHVELGSVPGLLRGQMVTMCGAASWVQTYTDWMDTGAPLSLAGNSDPLAAQAKFQPLPKVDSAEIEFEKPWNGRFSLSFPCADGEPFRMSFTARARYGTTYSLPLGSFALWGWAVDQTKPVHLSAGPEPPDSIPRFRFTLIRPAK